MDEENPNELKIINKNERLKYRLIINELRQQLEEKDKEIENCKRNELYEENMKILAFKNQKQLAIQELEKVKMMTEWKFNSIVDVVEYIDNQIRELKGE